MRYSGEHPEGGAGASTFLAKCHHDLEPQGRKPPLPRRCHPSMLCACFFPPLILPQAAAQLPAFISRCTPLVRVATVLDSQSQTGPAELVPSKREGAQQLPGRQGTSWTRFQQRSVAKKRSGYIAAGLQTWLEPGAPAGPLGRSARLAADPAGAQDKSRR